MKLKILQGDWHLIEVYDEDVLMETSFPSRIIKYNLSTITGEQMFKHCMLHELAHALQAELGQWQNAMSNGKRNDEFDSEFIAEFMALYSEYVLRMYNKVKHLGPRDDN